MVTLTSTMEDVNMALVDVALATVEEDGTIEGANPI